MRRGTWVIVNGKKVAAGPGGKPIAPPKPAPAPKVEGK